MAHGALGLAHVSISGSRIHWVETDPARPDDPRLMHTDRGGVPCETLPAPYAVRSGLYGYGALPYAVHGRTVFFVGAADQALYRYDPAGGALLLTDSGDGVATCYGAPRPAPDGRYVYCVRERKFDQETVHDLVAVPADGPGPVVVLSAGHDFYGAPEPHPNGGRVAFITWDHPDMPWDRSTLHEVSLGEDGRVLGDRVVAERSDESITQPRYGPDGRLHFVGDATGWWNLYREETDGRVSPLLPLAAEFGRPDWVCGLQSYGFLQDGTVLAAARRRGRDQLMRIPVRGPAAAVPLPFDVIDALSVDTEEAALVAASSSRPTAVVHLEGLPGPSATVVRESWGRPLGPEWISEPRPTAFRGSGGRVVHAFHYPPKNPYRTAPPGTLPPLIVSCHGGPTVVASASLNRQVQFWTSRGFAVVEVNYGGSSGHGRAYRERIRGQWGLVDAEDCVAAARHLVAEGRADPDRLVIRGLSSGGLTALSAAIRHTGFAAVISHSGVTDPASLVGATHKMESRYLDGLIGAWPAERERYRERSVVDNADRLRTPALFFHGNADPIVPMAQAEYLAARLAERGVTARTVVYEGESHGFRDPSNISHMVTTEIQFLESVLGLQDDGENHTTRIS
ncbi:S9 family peptidase [Streptomyces nitrosporeus]|uniref:S9 family peptidase n=1 Tax=Streptomyces nitrosporeus TaxID=28894 RepID=UPI0033198935